MVIFTGQMAGSYTKGADRQTKRQKHGYSSWIGGKIQRDHIVQTCGNYELSI